MSRATLYVRFPDGTVRYGLYCGTTDQAWPQLYRTPDAAWGEYGSGPDADDYKCRDGEWVEIATDYGGGGSWTGTATHSHVTSGHDPDDAETYSSGLPSWARYPR